jgi:hypothetical protein
VRRGERVLQEGVSKSQQRVEARVRVCQAEGDDIANSRALGGG